MPTQYFYPRKDADQLVWFKNMKAKFAGYATPLQISAGEVTATTADLTYLIWTWEEWIPLWRAYNESVTAHRNNVATGTGGLAEAPVPPAFSEPANVNAGALTRLFASIARWKTASGYTETIGQDLQIIGAEVPPGPSAPDLKGKVVGGVPQLTFVKSGHKGVYIEDKRGSAVEFAFLAIDTEKPYVDTRPLLVPGQPERREYRAKFWDGAPGVPEGDWSEIVRLTAGE